jgi:GTPase SAR1 family protein
MWDIGGQESLRASWANYYAGTDVWNDTSIIDDD